MEIIQGWKDAQDVANTVWADGNYRLLEGRLLFAYRTSDTKSELNQLIITQYRNDADNQTFKDLVPGILVFGISIVTKSWSAILPIVSLEYLENVILPDMKSYKIPQQLIDNFKNIIEKLK